MSSVQVSQAALNKLRICGCGNNLIAVNYCFDPSCKMHHVRFEFCNDCNTEELHDHRLTRIDVKCQAEDKQWGILLSDINDKVNKARHTTAKY